MTDPQTKREPSVMPGRPRIGLAAISSSDIAPLEKVLPGACPDVWREFAQSIYLTLLRHQERTQSADELARMTWALVQGIAQDLGGTQPYIPSGHFYSSAARAAAVRREFNGNNHRRLAAAHGVSESRIRQILGDK